MTCAKHILKERPVGIRQHFNIFSVIYVCFLVIECLNVYFIVNNVLK